MSNEKRLVLFLVLTFVLDPGDPVPDGRARAEPRRRKKPPAVAGQGGRAPSKAAAGRGEGAGEAGDGRQGGGEGRGRAEPPAAPTKPEGRSWSTTGELVLGSATDKSPERLSARGPARPEGGAASSRSPRRGTTPSSRTGSRRNRPLQLIRRDPVWPAVAVADPQPDGRRPSRPPAAGDAEDAARPSAAAEAEDCARLGALGGRPRRAGPRPSGRSPATTRRRRAAGRGPGGRLPDHGRRPASSSPRPSGSGRATTASRSSSGSRAPTRTRTVVYNLLGPHGIPIEGEWYTGTFRDVFFGQAQRRGDDRGRHPLGLRRRQGQGQARATARRCR